MKDRRYTKAEAVAALGVTNKTFNRWQAKFNAHPDNAEASLQWEDDAIDGRLRRIRHTELQRLAQFFERRIGAPPNGLHARHGDTRKSLQAHIAELEAEIAELRSRLTARPITLPTSGINTRPPRSRTISDRVLTSSLPDHVGLPGGSMRFMEMVRSHGVNEWTARDELAKRLISVTEVDIGRKDGQREKWVTPTQQAWMVGVWERLQTPGFTRCQNCPHTGDAESPSFQPAEDTL